MKRYVLSDFQFMPTLRIANTLTASLVGVAIALVTVALALFGAIDFKVALCVLVIDSVSMAPLIAGRSITFVVVGVARDLRTRALGTSRNARRRRYENVVRSTTLAPVTGYVYGSCDVRDGNCRFDAECVTLPIVVRFETKRPSQLTLDDEEDRLISASRWLDKLVDLCDKGVSKLRIVHQRDETKPNSGVSSYVVVSLKSRNPMARDRCEEELTKIMARNPEVAKFRSLSHREVESFCVEHFFEAKNSSNIRFRLTSWTVRSGSFQLWGVTDFGRFSGGYGEIFSLFEKIRAIRMIIVEVAPINQQRFSANIRSRRSRVDAKVLWRSNRGFSGSLTLAKAAKAVSEAEGDVANGVKGANFAFYLVTNRSLSSDVANKAKGECSIRLHGFPGVVRDAWEHVNPVVV